MAKKEITYCDPNHIIIVGIDTAAEEGDALYDERIDLDVDPNLVKNIMVYGVQQSVLVREDGGDLIVVDGRQRVRAARVANEQFRAAGEVEVKVPVVSVRGDDRRVTGIMISANEQRRDDTVLVRARKAQRMLDLVGSKADVAIAFGRTPQTINAWLRLASADSVVHEAIESGAISASAGVEIASLDRSEQAAAVAKLTKAAAPTVAAAKKQKAARKAQPGVKRSWVKKAMKTDAFNNLKPQQRAALEWFATGVAEKDSWMDAFVFDAEGEWEAETQPEAQAEPEAEAQAEPEVEVEPSTPVLAELDEDGLVVQDEDGLAF